MRFRRQSVYYITRHDSVVEARQPRSMYALETMTERTVPENMQRPVHAMRRREGAESMRFQPRIGSPMIFGVFGRSIEENIEGGWALDVSTASITITCAGTSIQQRRLIRWLASSQLQKSKCIQFRVNMRLLPLPEEQRQNAHKRWLRQSVSARTVPLSLFMHCAKLESSLGISCFKRRLFQSYC